MNSKTTAVALDTEVTVHSKALDHTISIGRKIGEFHGGTEGPTVIFVAGIHGNEPSGVFALKQVFGLLHQSDIHLKGKVFALSGNLTALSAGTRFVDKDLNRLWGMETIQKLNNGVTEGNSEVDRSKELPELLSSIERIFSQNKGPFYVIDLHTTSSETNPFFTIGDTLRNREFALKFPLPIVVGIEEQLDSTFLNYINELGHVALGVESGQHDDLSSIENHKSIIWLSLLHAGCIEKENWRDFHHHQALLAKTTIDSRKIFEIRYRYHIQSKEGFLMYPGFINFQRVSKGQAIASNRKGPIAVSESGRIFMPLYQKLGNDGFYLVREIRPFWLKVSAQLRKMKVDRLLHRFPGIRLHDVHSHTFLINKHIARWYVLEFFHLLGYRKQWQEGHHILMTKRAFDLVAPAVDA